MLAHPPGPPMSEETEEERTDPGIELPPETFVEELADSIPPRRASPPPLPPPPRTPSTDRAPPGPRAWAPTVPRASAPPPMPRISTSSYAQPRPRPARGESTRPARMAPPRLSTPHVPTRPPPPMPRDSRPPPYMPKPSEAPPAVTGLNPPQRQWLTQVESTLERARATMKQQQEAIDGLRAEMEALDETASAARGAITLEALEQRLSKDEAERTDRSRALLERVTEAARGAEASAGQLQGLEARLKRLEEGTEAVRIRMRLERVGHQLQGLEVRMEALEERLEEVRGGERLAKSNETRLARLESLFEELTEEVREERGSEGPADLGRRLEDLEGLVLKSGEVLESKRADLDTKIARLEALEAQLPEERAAMQAALARVEELSQSIPAPTSGGDDLTRIKGIGPKYARLLRDAGVSSFAQIAAWDDADLETVAAALGVKPARVHKAGWVQSAQGLAS